MRIVRFQHEGRVGIGVREGSRVLPTGHSDMLDLIRAGAEDIRPSGEHPIPLTACRLLAPLPNPGKMFFSGINFASHQEEEPGSALPTYPWCFSKVSSSIIGPGENIVLPYREAEVDYEAEMIAVIGRPARAVSREDALSYVFGYTIVNDVSGRDVQLRDGQVTTGKNFDTFCPMGPEIVTCDELPDPQALELKSYVNGELRQSEPAANMLFGFARMIEFFTQYITFQPGDAISSGTPAGCGTFRQPPLWLKPGDVVDVEVAGIGRISNPVIAG